MENNFENSDYLHIIKTFFCLSASPVRAYKKQYADMWFLGLLLPVLTDMIFTVLIGLERSEALPALPPIKIFLLSFIGIIFGAIKCALFTAILFVAGKLTSNQLSPYRLLSFTAFSYGLPLMIMIIALLLHIIVGWNVVLVFGTSALLLPLFATANFAFGTLKIGKIPAAVSVFAQGIVMLFVMLIYSYIASK